MHARRGREELVELLDRGIVPADERVSLTVSPGPEDFDTFYRREFPRLLLLARVLAGPASAEDVAQEALLVVYRRWDEVRSMASPAGWARSVCLHKAVSLVRRRTVERRVLRQLGAFRASSVIPGDEDEKFWSLVRRLPLRQAQVVALHYALDLAVVDVADTLGCAEGTVKVHLSRARAALAAALDVPEGEDQR